MYTNKERLQHIGLLKRFDADTVKLAQAALKSSFALPDAMRAGSVASRLAQHRMASFRLHRTGNRRQPSDVPPAPNHRFQKFAGPAQIALSGAPFANRSRRHPRRQQHGSNHIPMLNFLIALVIATTSVATNFAAIVLREF
jgi:hypothetical protein